MAKTYSIWRSTLTDREMKMPENWMPMYPGWERVGFITE